MKIKGKWMLVAGALLIAMAPKVQAEETPQNEGIQWQEPSDAVAEEAKVSSKFVLIDFYADWCGYCKKQDATSYQDDRVILMTDQLVPTKINEATYPDLIQKYKVTGFPTVVILNEEGEEVVRVAGAYEKEDYVRWLGSHLYKSDLSNLKAALEKAPNDIKLLTIHALIYNAAGMKDEVPDFLNRAGDAALAKFDAGETIAPDKTGQTVRAFRLLSLYFQSEQDYGRAAACLHFLAQLSDNPREVAASRLALAECLYQNNQTSKAIAELESFLKLNDLTAKEKQDAQTHLDTYKKAAA